METNLRKLLVDEQLPLKPEPKRDGGRLTKTVEVVVFDTEPGQVILTVSEDGESILAISKGKRFFPPLVEYAHPEQAVQERVVALFGTAACYNQEVMPEVPPECLLDFFRDRLGDDVRVLVGTEELAEGLEGPDVFLGSASPFAIGIRGRPGAIVTTPVGVGMFIQDVEAVAGALVAA